MNGRRRVLRSWPWTIALSSVLGGFVLLGLVGLGLRTSAVEVLISLVATGAAVAGLVRAMTMGAQLTQTGVIIRELTRTTRVPWTRVRSVTSQQTAQRRRVYAPVLVLAPERAVHAGRRGRGADERVEVIVLGSYREAVARRRADELARAFEFGR